MNKNIGTLDRSIRVVAAVLIVVLWLAGVLHGALAIILLIVAAAFLVTSAVSWCPLYLPLGLSTCKKQ